MSLALDIYSKTGKLLFENSISKCGVSVWKRNAIENVSTIELNRGSLSNIPSHPPIDSPPTKTLGTEVAPVISPRTFCILLPSSRGVLR